MSEVQDNLVELEGVIANQSREDWPEENLVTTKLNDVIHGIETSKQLGTLSDDNQETLQRIHSNLSRYPHDGNYSFDKLTKDDQEDFEDLREDLCEAGFGLRMQMSRDMDSLMNKIETLYENINSERMS